MASVEQLERKVERIRAEQVEARAAARAMRTAKGPWAATNLKANRKRQARLARELSEAGTELFRAKLALTKDLTVDA